LERVFTPLAGALRHATHRWRRGASREQQPVVRRAAPLDADLPAMSLAVALSVFAAVGTETAIDEPHTVPWGRSG
jgi:hypothetical protein